MRKRGVIVLFILLVAVLSLTTAHASHALSGKYVNFPSNQKYAVYSGPGTGYFRNANGKAVVSTNDWMEVYGIDQGWALIRYAVSSGGQRYGYIDGNYVPTDAGIGFLTFDNIAAYIIKDSALTDDPLEKQKAMAKLTAGTEVRELAHMGDWTYLEYGNMRGFVKTSDIAYSYDDRMGYAYTNRDDVNIRETANKNAEKVTTVGLKGTQLNIQAFVQGKDGYIWYHVYTLEGLNGFVRGDFLDVYWNTYQTDSANGSSEMGMIVFQSDAAAADYAEELPYSLSAKWPRPVKGDSMEEAYLKILMQYREGILAYQKFQLSEIEWWKESPYMRDLVGAIPLYTLLTDITGDGIPELLFMCTEKDADGVYAYTDAIYETHLYIFSWQNQEAVCILFFEDLYHTSGAYPWYTIYRSITSNDLYIQFGNNSSRTMKYILSEAGYYILEMEANVVHWEEEGDYYTVGGERTSQTDYDHAMMLMEISDKSILATTAEVVPNVYNILTFQEMIDWLKGIIVRSISKLEVRTDWPSAVAGSSINDAYLNVIQKYRAAIESYQNYQMEEIAEFENSSNYGPAWYESQGLHMDNHPLYTALLDVTGDGQPELLFIAAKPEYINSSYTSWGDMWADLYVFSWNGNEARCILYVENVYGIAANGPAYSVYRPVGSFSLYLNYTCNGPGTTECYVLNEYGYFSKWLMADVVLPAGDMDDPENEYTIEDWRGSRTVNKSEYLEAMKLLDLDEVEYIACVWEVDSDAFTEILTVQEMINRLNNWQRNGTLAIEVVEDADTGKILIDSTNFPDDAFRQLILDEIDTDHDGWLSVLEMDSLTVLDFWYRSDITSLQGIEYFRNLQMLDGGQTSLRELDVSKNTKLRSLSCQSNSLTSLILGNLPDLVELTSSNNALLQLDVSGCPQLQILMCDGNILSNLDISHNPQIYILACQHNYLYELDVTMLSGLRELHCFSNQIESLKLNNPLLNQIDCEGNKFAQLDIRACTELMQLVKEAERISGNLGNDSISAGDRYFTFDSYVELIFENDISQDDDSAGMNQEIQQTATTNTKNVNVRSEASKNSKKVTTLSKKGTSVTVISNTTGQDGYLWYYIETSKGTRGYIRHDFLDIDADFNITSGSVEEIYRQFVNEQFVSGKYEKNVSEKYDDMYLSYTLIDIDKDGTDELIVYTLVQSGEAWFYTCENGNVTPLEFEASLIPEYISSTARNCVPGSEVYSAKGTEAGILMGSYFGTGSHEFAHYIKQGLQMTKINNAEIDYNYGDIQLWLWLNGKDVTYAEMYNFFSKFDTEKYNSNDQYYRLIDYFYDAKDRWYEERGMSVPDNDATGTELYGFEAYEKIYRDFMNASISIEVTGSELIDIDLDDIPELVVYTQLNKGEAWFYTYANGTVVPLNFEADGSNSSFLMTNSVYDLPEVMVSVDGAGILVGGNVGVGAWAYYSIMKEGLSLVSTRWMEIIYDVDKPQIFFDSEESDVSEAMAFLSRYDITDERSWTLVEFMVNN